MLSNIPFILTLNISFFDDITIGVQRAQLRYDKKKEEESIKRPVVAVIFNRIEGGGPTFTSRWFHCH